MADATNDGRTSTLTAVSDKPAGKHRSERRKSRKGRFEFRTPSAKRLGVPFLFFGVGLPVLAVLFELSTHYCARNFFDPFPSPNHIVLFMLIPLSNFLVWLSGRRDMSAHYGFMCLISGMSMGIGILYALMFLPITAQAAMYTLVFGLGLLGFAPILSIPCSWLGGRTACHLASSRKTFFDPHQVEHIGHLIVLCLVVAVELPSTMTRVNLGLASDPATSAQGIRWLRQFGSEEVMLRACYERSGRATDILGSLYESAHPLSVDAARTIFFKVTGKPFNTVPIPASARGTIQHAGLVTDIAHVNDTVTDEFDLDADIAGETVSGVARGLSVGRSDFKGDVNSDAAVADLDFSFELKNVSAYDREARAKVQLAPGAVVTAAFVTVNGVEHEAKIMVRDNARQEYRQSVSEHKNPLLVSMSGADQVLVQCFPVQPNSSVIVRLKIATPLVVSQRADTCALQFPAFAERNFQLDSPVAVSLRGAELLSAPVEQKKIAQIFSPEGHSYSFDLANADVAKFRGTVTFKRDSKISSVIAPDSFSKSGDSIEHNVAVQHQLAPNALTVIVDGSASMTPYFPEIAKGLRSIPGSINTDVIVVGDEVLNLGSNKRPDIFSSSMDVLAKYAAAGGQSDGAEVVRILDGTPVLWIHGSQPFGEASAEQLSSLLTRSSSSPWLYDFATVAGPNELLANLQPSDKFVSVSRVETVSEDLQRLIASWETKPTKLAAFELWKDSDRNSSAKEVVPVKGVTDAHSSNKNSASASSSGGSSSNVNAIQSMDGKKLVANFPAIAQLYGYQQLVQSLNGRGNIPAFVFAERYHLVSPVSSAVVVDEVPRTSIPAPIGGSMKDHVDHWYKKKVVEPITESLNNLGSAHSSADLKVTEVLPAPAPKYSKGLQPQIDKNPNAQPSTVELPKSRAFKEELKQSIPRDSVSTTADTKADVPALQQNLAPLEKSSRMAESSLQDGVVAPNRRLELKTSGGTAPAPALAPAPITSPATPRPSLLGATNGTIGPDTNQFYAGTESGNPIYFGGQQERAYPVVPAQDAASAWLSQLIQGISIFALVFLTVFAGIKLLSALSLPKDY